jgi:putative ABC transport system permease protein
MDDLRQDLRLGLRRLRKAPGFTAVAIATLALGIGANTAVFSVVNQGLTGWSAAYDRPDELVMVWQSKGGDQWPATPFDFRDWKALNPGFAGLSAYYYAGVSLSGPREAERASAARVSADLFDTLGVKPLLGRPFRADEEAWGAHRVVLLAHGFWRRALGADAGVVGREIRIDGEPHTVVGVMPPGAWFTATPVDLWLPLAFAPDDPRNHRNSHFLTTIARLAPGVTLDQARTRMSDVAKRLEEHVENRGVGATVVSMRDEVLGDVRPVLLVLMGAVMLVLLVACANVANLLLARAAERRREMAVRLTLGAGRGKLVRQLLTESVLLAAAAGAAGLLLAVWGAELAAVLVPRGVPRLAETGVHLDGRALAFTLLVSVLTGIVFGLVPAWQASSGRLTDGLAEGGRGGPGLRTARARSAFVVAELGLAVLLLCGAGLLIRSFLLLQRVETGVRGGNLLTVRVPLPWSKSVDDRYVHTFFPQLLERVEALPGVELAGVSSHRPLGGGGMSRHFAVEGRPVPTSRADVPTISARQESARSLQALGVSLRRGRLFDEGDRAGQPRVAIVNEELVRRFFPNEDPIGQRVQLEMPESLSDPHSLPPGGRWPRWTIVGVIGNVRYFGLGGAPEPIAYVPYLQRNTAMPWAPGYLVVRTAGDPTSLLPAIRRQVAAVDPDQAAGEALTWEELRRQSVGGTRFNAAVMGAFAGVALGLAMLGVYGVLSYAVKQRRREIGVRMALGARGRDVARLVVGQGLRLAGIGVMLGLCAAVGLGGTLASLLFGVEPRDPATLAAVTLVLALTAAAACYLPARAASRLDPVSALRAE